jgi:hypothetical protein
VGDREPDIWDISDEELESWEAESEAADRHAAKVLGEALREHRGEEPPGGELASACARLRDGLRSGDHPFEWIRRGAGISAEPAADDADLLIACLAGTLSPREDTGLDAEEESAIMALEHADWVGAIVSAVRSGPGADASPAALVRGIYECPEVDVEAEPDFDGDGALVDMAFTLVSLPWTALGVIDQDEHLTRLGCWALPRALARAFGVDFDHPQGDRASAPGNRD